MFKLLLKKNFAYGKHFYYPRNADAQLICDILQHNTLMQWQVDMLKADGRFEIELEQETA